MANSYNSQPIVLDTDMASGWRALQTLAPKMPGIRVTKIMLMSNGTTGSAGTVSIVDPNDSTQLYPAIQVAATQTASGLVLLNDNLGVGAVSFRDFKVTGLTSTQTKLFIWYR